MARTRKWLRVSRDLVSSPADLRSACLSQMERIGVSRAWLVERCDEAGLDRSTVYRFLGGKSAVRWPVACGVAEILGLTIAPLPERLRESGKSQKCNNSVDEPASAG